MSIIMDCLKEHLTSLDFEMLNKVVEAMEEPPFRYSPRRSEFSPSDGWFLLDMDESDTDDLMDLAIRCCGILNTHACDLDTQESVEEEPRLLTYTVIYDIEDDALSDGFTKALKEAGYSPSSIRNGANSVTITIPFTASTDWEQSEEKDNIETIYSIVRNHAMGKHPKATRL